jgi:hypothetical protein
LIRTNDDHEVSLIYDTFQKYKGVKAL